MFKNVAKKLIIPYILNNRRYYSQVLGPSLQGNKSPNHAVSFPSPLTQSRPTVRASSAPRPTPPRPFVSPDAFHHARRIAASTPSNAVWAAAPRYPKLSTLQRENALFQSYNPIPHPPFNRAPVTRRQFYTAENISALH
eukprot:TRINITY_DN972_c0_g2_i3.p1 TRINITY_DN972_c0_g2~~TRINITY_DN972_c0_g2_i3.p1  ORF type:complete len:139 (-),score=17.52 TRINITY_DN972_c0_g2_i3:461-877(-)